MSTGKGINVSKPVIWSRSPSEVLVKYTLLRAAPDVPKASLLEFLGHQGVLFPANESLYLRQLSNLLEENQPDPFYPEDRAHRASQLYLIHHRVWGLWYPTAVDREAHKLFSNPAHRLKVCEFLTAGINPIRICEILSKHFSVHTTPQVVTRFEHHYWDLSSLTALEREQLMETARDSSVLLRALTASQVSSDPQTVQALIGVPEVSVVFDIVALQQEVIRDFWALNRYNTETAKKVATRGVSIDQLKKLVEMQRAALDMSADGGAGLRETLFAHLVHAGGSRAPNVGDLTEDGFRPPGLPGRRQGLVVIDSETEEVADVG